jgi:hypothetical protein
MDLVAAIGTPVHAVANGIVTVIDNDAGGYGNYIVIKHPNVPDPDNAHSKKSQQQKKRSPSLPYQCGPSPIGSSPLMRQCGQSRGGGNVIAN